MDQKSEVNTYLPFAITLENQSTSRSGKADTAGQTAFCWCL